MSNFTLVTTVEDAVKLVKRIQDVDRPHLVVHALPDGVVEPLIDVDDLARRVEGDALVYVIDFEMGYRLTEGLGGKPLTVHSGWTRIYPPTTWRDRDQSRNRFEPATLRFKKRQVLAIERRVLDLSFGSHLPALREAPAGMVPSTVTIDQTPSALESHIVSGTLPNRKTVNVITSGLFGGIPNNRLLRKGMTLPGEVTGGLLPHFYAVRPEDDPSTRTRVYVGGGIETWVFVNRVAAEVVEVLIHPEVAANIRGDADERLDLQFTQGETIPVLIIPTEDSYEIVVTDSSHELADAISALPDGPPWLLPPDPTPEVEELDDFDDEALSDELILAHREIARKDLEIASLKSKLRESQRRAKAKIARRPHDAATDCFAADIRNAYLAKFLDRVDREAYPLPILEFGHDLMDGIWWAASITSYEKLVEKAMLMACDHPGATVEAYKYSSPWADEVDGWKFFRGHVVEKTPGAPRLVIGRRAGVVKFEECGHHDDALKS